MASLLEPRRNQIHNRNHASSSWYHIKNLLSCKQIQESQIHHPNSICSDICSLNHVVYAKTRTSHRDYNSPDNTTETRLISKPRKNSSSSSAASVSSRSPSVYPRSAAGGYSQRGMHLRRFSGCYECHAIVDPTRCPVARASIYVCSECGEIFPNNESSEHHRAVKHAVCEVGPDDSSRSIVEIIFKSSWLKKDNPICKIERILKVHNTQRTIQRFEDYRDVIKIRAKKNARCAADGNELLRFHAATLLCALGARGCTSLCSAGPSCGVCTIIRHGFQGSKLTGIRTTATSGRAHDCIGDGKSEARRAMLVCRVIAGRVKRVTEDAEDDDDGGSMAGKSFDSVGSLAGVYSSLEELFVFSSRAILPCFVVIYKSLES